MTPTGPRPRGSPCRHPRVSRLLHTQSCSLRSCRGRPLEEISSYTLRPTRCPAMQGCSRRPGCSARPAPAHPMLGSWRSARWAVAPCPAGGETGPHGGTSVCSRQPRPSGGVSAHSAPGATGGASRGEGGAWRQALGWLTSARCVLGLRTLSWRPPQLVPMTDLDRQGGAGWRKGLPGSLDGEVGHDVSTLRVSPQGNKHSLPGCPPGSRRPGNRPFPSYLAGVSQDLVQPACG